MKRYSFYVDPHTGQSEEATDEQLVNETSQIVWFNGPEIIDPPVYRIGPQNDRLYAPATFENENGDEHLQIPIGSAILTRLVNINPGRYQAHYQLNGQPHVTEYEGFYTIALKALSQL